MQLDLPAFKHPIQSHGKNGTKSRSCGCHFIGFNLFPDQFLSTIDILDEQSGRESLKMLRLICCMNIEPNLMQSEQINWLEDQIMLTRGRSSKREEIWVVLLYKIQKLSLLQIPVSAFLYGNMLLAVNFQVDLHLLLGTDEVSGDIGKVVNTIGAAGEGP